MTISVIIPIYNVEDYVFECVESVLNQTMKDLEIILVNDGSTDNSIRRIRNVIEENDNILLINQKNKGLSAARNTGLKHAQGEYIIFIDSDDYIQPTFLEHLYIEAKQSNVDVVIGGYTRIYQNKGKKINYRKKELLNLGIISGKKYLYRQLQHNDYQMQIWSNLYNRQFLLENNLFFIENLLHEDEEFTPRSLLKADTIVITECYEYMYRMRDNSIMTKSPNLHHIESCSKILNLFIENYSKQTDYEAKESMKYLIFRIISAYEDKVLKSNIEDKKKYLLKLKNKEIVSIIKDMEHLTSQQKFKYFILEYINTLFYPMLYLKAKIKK